MDLYRYHDEYQPSFCMTHNSGVKHSLQKVIRRIFGSETRWRLYKKLFDTITIETKQGIFTISTKDNAIGKELFCCGEYELSTIRRVFSTLTQHQLIPNSAGTLIDIGANCGVISIGVLTQGYLKRAIAIEPDPLNFSLLLKNVQHNRLENQITPLQFAVSDKSCKVLFELAKDNLGDHRVRTSRMDGLLPEMFGESQRSVIEIESRRLDAALKDLPETITQDISLVWMDVQGYEGYALRGAETLFSKPIPLMSELWPYGIIRSGFSQLEYCSVVKEHWRNVWVCRDEQYVRYCVDFVEPLWNELGEIGRYENVIYTQ
jgi:FkbM family methyltransferase